MYVFVHLLFYIYVFIHNFFFLFCLFFVLFCLLFPFIYLFHFCSDYLFFISDTFSFQLFFFSAWSCHETNFSFSYVQVYGSSKLTEDF